mgnify:CR=1 FL=1
MKERIRESGSVECCADKVSKIRQGLSVARCGHGDKGQSMRLKPIVLTLSPDEAREVVRIDMDGDMQAALSFVRAVLAKRVKEALKTH